jgi:hypothetical protein
VRLLTSPLSGDRNITSEMRADEVLFRSRWLNQEGAQTSAGRLGRMYLQAEEPSGRNAVDAINGSGVSAGHFSYFRVVSRSQNQHLRRSGGFMRLVRFPAAPLKKGHRKQALLFSYRADINRSSTSVSQVSTTLRPTQRQQSPTGLAVDAVTIDQLSLRISRSRKVASRQKRHQFAAPAEPAAEDVFRCRAIKS